MIEDGGGVEGLRNTPCEVYGREPVVHNGSGIYRLLIQQFLYLTPSRRSKAFILEEVLTSTDRFKLTWQIDRPEQ